MHLDTVLKPVTGFKANTKGLDTQLFKRLSTLAHVQTDSVTSCPSLFVGDTLLQSTIQNTNMLYTNNGI